MSDEKMETVSSFAQDEYKDSYPYASAVEIVEMVSEIQMHESTDDDEKSTESATNDPRSRLLKMLDGLEEDVETLRKSAIALEDKRDTMLGKLDVMRQSKALDLLDEGAFVLDKHWQDSHT
jgi:hypothetical protein